MVDLMGLSPRMGLLPSDFALALEMVLVEDDLRGGLVQPSGL